eukprot:gene11444-34152_t
MKPLEAFFMTHLEAVQHRLPPVPIPPLYMLPSLVCSGSRVDGSAMTQTGLRSRSCRCYMVKGCSLYEETGGSLHDASRSSLAQATTNADPLFPHAGPSGLSEATGGSLYAETGSSLAQATTNADPFSPWSPYVPLVCMKPLEVA